MGPGSPAREAPEAPPALRSLAYEDLRVLIEGTAGGYRASVVESPAGESSAPETIRWALPVGRLEKESDLQRVGASLFDAFFTGQVRDLYRESCAVTGARQRGLRVKLLIDPLELSGAPWELLYDSRNRRYIGLSTKTPIIRHPRIPQPAEPLLVQPPLRVLGLIANPLDPNFPPLDVQKERELIETALADARRAGLVELKWLDGGTWEQLQAAMWQGWHAFHFCGHGDHDGSGEGYLVLENAGGKAHRLAAAQLGLLLREQGAVRLAILNACKGAVGDTSASSSSVAGTLVRAGLGGVVSMQNPITDQAALSFARVIYLGIAQGLPLDAALGSARVAMAIEHTHPIEWWTPVLHMRSNDGALFDVPEALSSTPADIREMRYLRADVDRQLERALARRRWLGRLFLSWLLVPVAILGFLTATGVASDVVRAEIEASGVTFVLSSEREFFGELPRLQRFSAVGFSQVVLPGSAFPQKPGPEEESDVHALAVDAGSWISLHPWILPAGSLVAFDHPPGTEAGEYRLVLAVGSDRRFRASLVRRNRLSRFGSRLETHDFGDTSSIELVSSGARLDLSLRFLNPADVTTPRLDVASLELLREGFSDGGPSAEPTLLNARIHFNGRDTLIDSIPLSFIALEGGSIERLRLIDRGLAFTVGGTIEGLAIGGRALPFPSRLQWLMREQPLYLVVGTLAYALILVALLVSWRTSHAAKA